MAKAWYYFNGSDGQEDDLSKYARPATTFTVCPTGSHLCAVYAEFGGPNPLEISDNLVTYIAATKATHVPQPSTPIGAVKYAYSRSI